MDISAGRKKHPINTTSKALEGLTDGRFGYINTCSGKMSIEVIAILFGQTKFPSSEKLTSP
jgi:hypothetical protein